MSSTSQPLGFTASRPLVYFAGATLLVTVCSLARAIVMPLALAALISFVLVPPVALLERRGLNRAASVAVVLLLVLGGVAGFGYALSRQVTDLAAHMPQYSASIKSKLAALRETREGALTQIQHTVDKVGHDLDKQEKATGSTVPETPAVPRPVLVVPSPLSAAERLRTMWEPVATPITTAGIVLILVAFMLGQREDIRNRLIRLAGQGRLTVTTRTLDEAAQRISRFLLTQSLINAAFGLFITVGLLLIGIPYALLWGATAALLRFVPYLGTTLAMLMAAGLAFFTSEGWAATIETLVLFWAAGLTAYVLDPIFNGSRTGTSSFALLVSTILWTWLWGPVGLLLATPLTVSLVAVGKHVPEMEFLAVLLSDEQPLETEVSFYQRLLAGDEDEASDILGQEFGKATREAVFDRIVVPTLVLAARDRLRDRISYAEQQFVVHSALEIVRNSAVFAGDPAVGRQESAPRRKLLGVPARTASDQLALEMLSQLLGDGWTLTQLPLTSLASDVFIAIEKIEPDIVCIAALAPGGLSHVRYLCKQVHRRFPEIPIWGLRVGVYSDPLKLAQRLLSDGAHNVATSFTEAAIQIQQLLVETKQDRLARTVPGDARGATHFEIAEDLRSS